MAIKARFVAKLDMDGTAFIQQVHSAQESMQGLNGTVERIQKSFASFHATLSAKGIAGAAVQWGLAAKAMQVLSNAVHDAAKMNMDFERSMAGLAAITGATRDGIVALEAEARRLGGSTAYSAKEVAELETELAKLGFAQGEILQSTEAVLNFSLATGSGLGEAAAVAGNALRAFGGSASEMERYVSAMAVGTTKSALSFSFLQTAIGTIAPVARTFGFSIEDTIAILGTLADAGFDANTAATATRNILLNLANASGALAHRLGQPIKTVPQLAKALIGLRQEGASLNTTLKLTDTRSVAAFNVLMQNAEKLESLRGAVTGVEGELQTMAATMADTVSGAVSNLSSAWEELMLRFGDAANGPARTALNMLANLLQSIADQLGMIPTQINLVRAALKKNQASDAGVLNSILGEYKGGSYDSLIKEYEGRLRVQEAAIPQLESKRREGNGSGIMSARASQLKKAIAQAKADVQTLKGVLDELRRLEQERLKAIGDADAAAVELDAQRGALEKRNKLERDKQYKALLNGKHSSTRYGGFSTPKWSEAANMPSPAEEETIDELLKAVPSIANLQAKIEKARLERQRVGSQERRNELAKEIDDMEKLLAAMNGDITPLADTANIVGDIDGIANALMRFGSAATGSANAWEVFMAGLGAAQSVVSGVQSLIEVTKTLKTASTAVTAAKVADTVATETQAAMDVAGATAAAAATAVKTAALQAEAGASQAAAVSGAAAAVAATPFVGPALATAAASEMFALLEGFKIASMAFAEGGITGIIAGNSPSGDKVLARVNSGEMILNKKQQAALYGGMFGGSAGALSVGQQKSLFGAINGFAGGGITNPMANAIPIYAPHSASSAQVNAGSVGRGEVQVTGDLVLEGTKLRAVLHNTDKKHSRF